ncbi:MAG: DUF4912 domain-containing protein [Chitinispirillales bacterium]|jgi:hypothetical protein|nr:DUF4912 domain-containing protein [Chitinispirillales bacterium]
MSVSKGKSRALKRFLRNKFRAPQKQSQSEPQKTSDESPAYSLSTQIPRSYNDRYVRAIPRDPQCAFVYWERPSQKSADSGGAAEKNEEHAAGKHETIKIQHTPAFQSVEYPQTVLNFQADNNNDNQTNSHHANTIAQINPQSDSGSAYIQTPQGGGEIKAEYGIESSGSKKPFEVLTSSPAVHTSEPTIKQIADIKKGVDTNALVSFFSVNLAGIDHLSSGEFYNIDTEKKS